MDASEAPEIWLVRHGETEWSRSGQHTSVTDLPLTAEGEAVAGKLAGLLSGHEFARVLTSPRRRALRTAELSGFVDAEVTEDLAEWAYGDYEGITTPQIREQVPGWTVWTHPSPGGESAEQVTERLQRVVDLALATPGRTLVFSHGHALRALAALWLRLPVSEGRLFKLDTATLSVLGHDRETPAILRWNA